MFRISIFVLSKMFDIMLLLDKIIFWLLYTIRLIAIYQIKYAYLPVMKFSNNLISN